ncbi:MAG: hypothetical protein IKH47_03200, partial [Bacteroidaceae bacterium]|nr:hypothetical protein [Bacteroidaceae bacterium]
HLDAEMLTLYASCLMSAGKPEEAVRIYERELGTVSPAAEGSPSSEDEGQTVGARSLYSYAVALSQTGRYADACQALYQEDYLRPDQVKVVRLLAWCCLRSDADAALSHYQRLLAMQPLRLSDWLNAGHAALAAGHTSQAIDYYRHSQATSLTESDRSLLLSLSVSPLIVNLVTDLLEKEVGK